MRLYSLNFIRLTQERTLLLTVSLHRKYDSRPDASSERGTGMDSLKSYFRAVSFVKSACFHVVNQTIYIPTEYRLHPRNGPCISSSPSQVLRVKVCVNITFSSMLLSILLWILRHKPHLAFQAPHFLSIFSTTALILTIPIFALSCCSSF